MDGTVRVLHVENDPGFRKLTATVLERQDDRFSIDAVSSVGDALDRLDGNRYDCVVSDYDMPTTSGVEFLEAVRESHPDLPFILFTGKGSEEVASEAMAAGVTDYLQKRGGTEQYELLGNRIDNAVSQYNAERELERQNDLFEKAQRIADIGVWEVDLKADEVWWSDQVNRIYRLHSEFEFEPGDGFEFYHPEDRPVARKAFERAVRAGEPYDHELRVVRDGGSVRWVRVQGDPQFENGDVARVRGTIQDVTEDKQRRTVLESLNRVATTIQGGETTEEVCERTVSAAGDILDLEVCTILLRDGEQLVPEATSAGAPPDASRAMRIDQGLAGKTCRTGESQVVDDIGVTDEPDPARPEYRSGVSVPIAGHGVFQAVSTETGAFGSDDVEFVELLLSHTESALDRLTREQELQRQNERLAEFASIVSHDLRNPLNVAQLQLELARADHDSDPLENVEQAHDRMEALIEDLLALARAGEPADDRQPVELATFAERAWRNVETPGARLVTNAGEVIQADGNRLQQLLENLVRNAVEHGSTSSQPAADDAHRELLTVRIETIDDVGFAVEDDGSGIPPDEREDVFASGYSTTPDGTGFGLSIVADIADAHDWDIRVTDGEDGGARFEITGVEFVRP